MIAFHSSRSSALTPFNPKSRKSSSTLCFQVFFGLPRGLLPGATTDIILPNGSLVLLLTTCPNQFSLLFVITISSGSNRHLLKISSVATLSLSLTLHIFRSILRSHFIRKSSTCRVAAQVSDPYSMVDLMQAPYTLALWCRGIPGLQRREDSSLHLIHAHDTLALAARSDPPSQSSTSPR